MRISILVPAGVLAAAVAPSASAQLVFGTTTTSTSNPGAVYLDVTTGATTTLWNSATNKKVNGMAADTDHYKIYANDAARLNVWNYGSVGTTPTQIGGIYRTNDNVTFTATGVDGLAWASGKLYASTSFQSTTYKRGIYELSTTADAGGHCVMKPLWLDPTGVGSSSGTIQFGGLDYNAADGKFWVTNGTDTTGTGGTLTRGLFTVDAFGSGAMVKIADFPTGHTQIDGLAIGGGYAWMTEQSPTTNAVNIFGYNIAAGMIDKTLTFALADTTQRASGAAWAPYAYAPAPGSVAVLGLGGLMTRRKRK